MMGRKGALSETEKFKIIEQLHSKITTLEIAKELGSDHRINKKIVISPVSAMDVLTREKF